VPGRSSTARQVWINLLSNALKFTRQQEMARIEIGCQTEADGEQVYLSRITAWALTCVR